MKTYTRAIKDLDDGKLPKWAGMSAPDIGKASSGEGWLRACRRARVKGARHALLTLLCIEACLPV